MGTFSLVNLIIAALIGAAIWRWQLIGKRHFEVAEETLIAFAQAKNAFDVIRSPAGFAGEGGERPRAADETDAEARQLDAYFVPIARIKSTQDQFAPLDKVALLCRFHFGAETEDIVRELIRARHKVLVSARMLMTTERRGARREAEPRADEVARRRRWEADIWATDDEEDEIARRLVAAEAAINEACARHLQWRSSFWPRRKTLIEARERALGLLRGGWR